MGDKVKIQMMKGAHLAKFFLTETAEFDEDVFLGVMGSMLIARGGDGRKALELLIKLGDSIKSGIDEGVM